MDTNDLKEVQKSILGILLCYPESISKLQGYLKPEHFSLGGYGRIYKEMLHQYDISSTIDIITISHNAATESIPENVLMGEFKKYISETTVSAPLLDHAKILIDDYKSKRFRAIRNLPTVEGETIDDKICETITLLEGLKTDRKVNTRNIVQIYKENSEKYFNKEYDPNYLSFGFSRLDKILGGVENTDLVCIGARPSVGKSAFVMNVAMNVSKVKKVMMFSLEMSKSQILDRLLSAESNLPLSMLRHDKEFKNKSDELRFTDAIKNLEKYKLIINDSGGITVSEMRNECKNMNDLGLIIIDYLQLITPDTKSQNRSVEIGNISRALKKLSMELHVPIIVLSQLNRSVEYRADKEPTLSDLRESGDIEQDCNSIMFLWNPDKTENGKMTDKRNVSVAKNRQGETGISSFKFNGAYMKFYELDTVYSYKQEKKSDEGNGFMSLDNDNYDDMPFH